jgi:hypothetical protein
VGKRESVADCVVVAPQSGDEAVQVGQVVGVDACHPGVQAITVAAGEHQGERVDVGCRGVEVWAGG